MKARIRLCRATKPQPATTLLPEALKRAQRVVGRPYRDEWAGEWHVRAPYGAEVVPWYGPGPYALGLPYGRRLRAVVVAYIAVRAITQCRHRPLLESVYDDHEIPGTARAMAREMLRRLQG